MKQVLMQWAKYTGDPLIANLDFHSWVQVFELIAREVRKGSWTIYFEEVQWLANYQNHFISELKYVWDNYFRYNDALRLILCGSSPSFMINQVLHSKALYNRSMYEIPLQPFTLHETALFFKKRSQREIMDAYLTIGGIPEYLKRIKSEPSLFIGICKNAFKRGGYFTNEYKRIFISSLSGNKHYKLIIEYLSKVRFTTRDEISKHLNIKSGGQLTELLNDLILCGFMKKYVPYHLKPNSMLTRYVIRDNYLNFYFKFIAPLQESIEQGDYNGSETSAIDTSSYFKWLGFSFERFCRDNHKLIATILGFPGIRYRHGAFYSRRTNQQSPGYQIDLLFDRADKVLSVCEIRYIQGKVGISVIEEFERKLALLPTNKHISIQKVLITTEGAADNLIGRAYFDRVITLEAFFSH